MQEILESMIKDAVARQKKGGDGSRTIITSAMSGFLVELADTLRTSGINGRPLAKLHFEGGFAGRVKSRPVR